MLIFLIVLIIAVLHCSLYGKLFDNAVLMYFSCKLETKDLQFGFITKHSTSQCTFVLKESLVLCR